VSINHEIEETAKVGLKRLREYLENPSEEGAEVARVGISAVRAHTSAESTAMRKLSSAISAWKLMGTKGEELRPIFQALSGGLAQLVNESAVIKASETSSAVGA